MHAYIMQCRNKVKHISSKIFFFLQCWDLELRPLGNTLALQPHPQTFFALGFFFQIHSHTFCPGWPQSVILLPMPSMELRLQKYTMTSGLLVEMGSCKLLAPASLKPWSSGSLLLGSGDYSAQHCHFFMIKAHNLLFLLSEMYSTLSKLPYYTIAYHNLLLSITDQFPQSSFPPYSPQPLITTILQSASMKSIFHVVFVFPRLAYFT
jgi:hypothetical protein